MKTKLWNCGTCFVDNIDEICTNCESNSNKELEKLFEYASAREKKLYANYDLKRRELEKLRDELQDSSQECEILYYKINGQRPKGKK